MRAKPHLVLVAMMTGVCAGLAGCSENPGAVPSKVREPSVKRPLPLPPRPPASGEFRIAFESNRDGDDAIFVATADGAVVKRLTAGIQPAWSPDAREVAYTAGVGLFVIGVDGSGRRQVGSGYGASWSPDGRRIAFSTGDRAGGIAVVNTDGSGQTVIIPHAFAYPGYDTDYGVETPRWTPDGSRLSFARLPGYDDVWTFHTANPDGSDIRRVNIGSCDVRDLAWSPDGTRLACVSYFGGSALFIAIPGSGPVLSLSSGGGRSFDGPFSPDWSPDGTEVAFSRYDFSQPCSVPNCPMRIFAVSASGTTPADRQLIPDAASGTNRNYRDNHVAWARVR